MGNKPYAMEWMRFAYRSLRTAQKLFEVEHYMDIIGAEIQQSVEKSLKALLAFHNRMIPRTHELVLLLAYIDKLPDVDLNFREEELDLLDRISLYYKFERYPNPNYFVPDAQEVKNSLLFAEALFDDIVGILQIDASLFEED